MKEHKKTFVYLLALSLVILSTAYTVDIVNFFGYYLSGRFLEVFAIIMSMFIAVYSLYYKRETDKDRKEKIIFISYSKEDIEDAKKISEYLKKNGFNVWLDAERLLPGDIWEKAVYNAIEASSVVLVLISKSSDAESNYLTQEIEHSLKFLQSNNDSESPIIPIRLSDVKLPKELEGIQSLDIFDDDLNMEKLLLSIKRIVENI
jgi:hypothetical protein